MPYGDVSDLDFDSSSSEDLDTATKFKRNISSKEFSSSSDSDESFSEDQEIPAEVDEPVTSKSKATKSPGSTRKSYTKKPKCACHSPECRKCEKPIETWAEGDLGPIECDFLSNAPVYDDFVTEHELPIDYFRRFMKDSIIAHMATATNEYSVSKKGSSIEVNFFNNSILTNLIILF